MKRVRCASQDPESPMAETPCLASAEGLALTGLGENSDSQISTSSGPIGLIGLIENGENSFKLLNKAHFLY